MSLINISNLTFEHEGSYEKIFENVNFHIDTNWKLGLIGRNGRGKTTFFKLLLDKYEYRGTISRSVDFDYFPIEIEDKSKLTYEIIESINFDYEHWELLKEFSVLNLKEDILYRSFDTLSNGEQTKVLLATMFLKKNNFLLLDEPTNHLDIEARELVSSYLNSKKGFILISHDSEFLDGCVDHILSINKANIEIQKGNFSMWYTNKQLQDNFELKQYDKLSNEISRLKKSSLVKESWSNDIEKSKIGNGHVDKGYIGHKSAKMMKRAKSIQKRQEKSIADKSNLLKNIEKNEELMIRPLEYFKEKLIYLNDVSIRYENKICSNVTFEIKQGDRVALIGKNGCGKSSIIKLICNEKLDYTGECNIGSKLIISTVSQDTSYLKGSLKDFIFENGIDETIFKTNLRKLDFSREHFSKNIEEYSEGQKKKILIAKSLSEKAHIYIWDEPLNFIDILSRKQIEELLLQFKPTILFVEHDKAFCEKISTKKVYL